MCGLEEASIILFLPPQFFVCVRLSKSSFLTHTEMQVKLNIYNFKIVSVLTFLKIVFLIVPINCKTFANIEVITQNLVAPDLCTCGS
jgi:hypothetical protein